MLRAEQFKARTLINIAKKSTSSDLQKKYAETLTDKSV